jgi:transposase
LSAHICRQPERKKHGAQNLGRSRGGFSTKIHLAVDALGNALRFILIGGECSDHRQAENLISGFVFDYLIADKGYDSYRFVKSVKLSGAKRLFRLALTIAGGAAMTGIYTGKDIWLNALLIKSSIIAESLPNSRNCQRTI